MVSPLCTGLASVVEERWNAASATLTSVVATMAPLGGSKAQREVVEDTLVHALAMAGRSTEATAVLRDALSTVAVTTMFALAMAELHVELVAGAAAWLAAGWLLRERVV